MWMQYGHFLMILKTSESSKTWKSGFWRVFSTPNAIGASPPPWVKNPDFLRLECFDRSETFAIHSTHGETMWMQSGHFLITLKVSESSKTFNFHENPWFSLILVGFWELHFFFFPPRPPSRKWLYLRAQEELGDGTVHSYISNLLYLVVESFLGPPEYFSVTFEQLDFFFLYMFLWTNQVQKPSV